MGNRVKQKLDPNVVKLGAVSLLTDVSSEMIFPILPLFLTTVLGAPAAVVGLIEGIAESTANVLKLFSGWLSDKLGRRKPFVIAGYGLSCVSKPFFAVANSWPFVLAVRFSDRVGKGIRVTARDVMVADYTTEANRGYAFGFRKAMDSLGAVIGPLVVFVVLPAFLVSMSVDAAYRTVFWLAAIPAFLALAIVLTVREKKRVAKPATPPKIDFAVLRGNKRFRLNLAVAFLFGLGNFSYAFFVLRAQDLAFTAVAITLVYAAYNAVYALAAIPAGRLSDKNGR
ncbi:MAG: MFS transporter, partial [Candidatus Micrarchaeota archaeon]